MKFAPKIRNSICGLQRRLEIRLKEIQSTLYNPIFHSIYYRTIQFLQLHSFNFYAVFGRKDSYL